MAKSKRKNKKGSRSPHKNRLIKKAKPDNLLKGLSRGSVHDEDNKMSFNLRHLDEAQGSTLKEWGERNILCDAITTLKSYSSMTLEEAQQNRFTIYKGFPPKDRTDFFHPIHVPPDAQWASMHVNGPVCLAGHVVGTVFFVVFLDLEHRFWISKLKHT